MYSTASKVSLFGTFLFYFPTYGMNMDQKNSEYGHFTHSALVMTGYEISKRGSNGPYNPLSVLEGIPQTVTAQKMKFYTNNFFNKRDQIRRKLRIWLHLLKKFLMESFIFCGVSLAFS